MKKRAFAALSLALSLVGCASSEFEPPVRVMAGGAAVRVEQPGFACPCLADIDGNGKPDLLVGQFAEGKIQYCKNLGGGKFASGEWIQAEGKAAEVPGVW